MLEARVAAIADVVWSYPVVGLCLLGAVFFTVRLGFVQLRALPHAIALLRGRYDRDDEHGEISHFQALSAALSGTIGIGNIGGVAVAIGMGGPGAILWMWVLGVFGMATKFVECTLATHYREAPVDGGEVRGGPMYYIPRALGPRWAPVGMAYAVILALAGFGFSCMFQSNQAASALEQGLGVPTWISGVVLVGLGAATILGGIKRIAATAARLVPAMCLLYMGGALLVCVLQIERMPAVLWTIVEDGFSGRAALGGAVGAVIMAGVRRAVFSNEAGLGSAGIAHAAVKTDQPVREGIVASLGPMIDTVIVSGATAFVLVLAGHYGAEMDQAESTQGFERGEVDRLDLPPDWRVVSLDPAMAGPPVQGLHGLSVVLDGEQAAPLELPFGVAPVEGVRLSSLRRSGTFIVEVWAQDRQLARGVVHPRAVEDAQLAGSAKLQVEGCRLDGVWQSCGFDLRKLDVEPNTPLSLRLVPVAEHGVVDLELDRVQRVHRTRGIALTAATFDETLPGFGTYVIPIAGFLFAFSTMVTWSYYGETAATYALGPRSVTAYRLVFIGLAFVGATQDLGIVISVSDILVGLLVVPNMIALVALSGRVAGWSKTYFEALRRGDFD